MVASSWKYLCFKFDGVTYQFTTLCFGLSVAVFIASYLTNCIADSIRARGHETIVFIDDFLNDAKGQSVLKETLNGLGILMNKKKTVSSKVVKYLGHIIDCENNVIRQSASFQSKMKDLVWDFGKAKVKKSISVSAFESFVGKVIFFGTFENAGYTNTLEIYDALNEARERNLYRIKPSKELKEEIAFWLSADRLKPKKLQKYAHGVYARIEVSTDASKRYGGVYVKVEKEEGSYKTVRSTVPFNEEDRCEHINLQEALMVLEGIDLAIRSAGEILDSSKLAEVSMFCDSKVTLGAIKKRRSSSEKLNNVVKNILMLINETPNLVFRFYYVKSEENIADELSRPDDKALTLGHGGIEIVKKIARSFGWQTYPCLDLMASATANPFKTKFLSLGGDGFLGKSFFEFDWADDDRFFDFDYDRLWVYVFPTMAMRKIVFEYRV